MIDRIINDHEWAFIHFSFPRLGPFAFSLLFASAFGQSASCLLWVFTWRAVAAGQVVQELAIAQRLVVQAVQAILLL